MAKNRKTSTHRRDLSGLRGRERAEHFANGGTVAQWRGAARTYDNKTKARASKEACRGRVTN
ncbi:MAG TPA: hypothetical protein VMW08_00950 [Acidimicrobiales bacterium]|nr:hypothetical protein [Acidimicrobiales bacterium]